MKTISSVLLLANSSSTDFPQLMSVSQASSKQLLVASRFKPIFLYDQVICICFDFDSGSQM